MAKSIRLRTETQDMVAEEVRRHFHDTALVVSDAQMVDALVRDGLKARAEAREKRIAKNTGRR